MPSVLGLFWKNFILSFLVRVDYRSWPIWSVILTWNRLELGSRIVNCDCKLFIRFEPAWLQNSRNVNGEALLFMMYISPLTYLSTHLSYNVTQYKKFLYLSNANFLALPSVGSTYLLTYLPILTYPIQKVPLCVKCQFSRSYYLHNYLTS